MKNPLLLPVLLAALPLAATAQTTAKPATRQVTEVSEDLDPATGKVVRRTTRTYAEPVTSPGRSAATETTTASKSAVPGATAPATAATDAGVSAFLNTKTAVATLTAPQLLQAYATFMDKVRDDRRDWSAADWSIAAAVLSSLNARYEQLRGSYSLDDKLTIRSQQAEFQTLRTARQLSDQVSDKL